MSQTIPKSVSSQAGFSLLEFAMVCFILILVMGSIFGTIGDVTARSASEQVKTELTQEGREFIDEFQRDLHQSGYPNCRMIATSPSINNCDFTKTAVRSNQYVALGLVYVSNTEIVFEGDVDGDGVVDLVWYRLVDQNGNYPPSTTCPCTIQRSQNAKASFDWNDPNQNTVWSQELQGVINSGTATGTSAYTTGSGLTISGTTPWGASNDSYYGSLSTVKDYPVFTGYDNSGNVIPLPLDITTSAGQDRATGIPGIKSVRLMINLLADATTGVDLRNHTRPVETIVGNARIVNCGGQPCD
jgi:type II secretory pathway pseudopilin PulG